MKRLYYKTMFVATTLFLNVYEILAQGGQANSNPGTAGSSAMSTAATQVGSMFDAASNLILAIGAIVGLAGGIRCYTKWNTGDQDVMKSVMGWGGACIFLLIVGVTIKAFFIPNASSGS